MPSSYTDLEVFTLINKFIEDGNQCIIIFDHIRCIVNDPVPEYMWKHASKISNKEGTVLYIKSGNDWYRQYDIPVKVVTK